MVLFDVFSGIVLDICCISLFVFVIIKRVRELPDHPLYDRVWQINYEELYDSLREFVSNKQEKICTVLNVQDALHLPQYGTSQNGFAIITDKACYFVGKVYRKKGMLFFGTNIRHRIVLNELKGVRTEKLSRVDIFISSILSVILTILDIKWLIYVFRKAFAYEELYYGDYEDRLGVVAIFTILIAFIMFCLTIYCFVRAFILKKTVVCLEFTSLTVSFPVCTLGAEEIDNFYKVVSEVQEQYLSTVTTGETSKPSAPAQEDKIQSLSELSKLYEQGMISEEEFHKLKAEVINN